MSLTRIPNSNHLDETVVKAEVVSDAVLPALPIVSANRFKIIERE